MITYYEGPEVAAAALRGWATRLGEADPFDSLRVAELIGELAADMRGAAAVLDPDRCPVCGGAPVEVETQRVELAGDGLGYTSPILTQRRCANGPHGAAASRFAGAVEMETGGSGRDLHAEFDHHAARQRHHAGQDS